MSNANSHTVERDMLATLGPPGGGHKFLVIGLALVVAWAVVAYIHQLRIGLAATAMSDYFSWGVYIVNFVFFIGISMAGSLISAMLRLSNAHWRHPISRLAEAITVFSLLVAGPMIIIDMGRPDRFLHVILYGRLQSPILWDVLSLTSYLAGSFLYLYVPMIPDLAILRDAPGLSRWRKTLYRALAMRWNGTADQHRNLERAVSVMAIVILPVAVSIHTVTAWLFGMTLRPGWHSTIIGPDFVIGALYSGVAAVITAIVLFRYFLHLQAHIPVDHLRKLAKLMLVFGLAYAYFVINEHVGAAYTGEGAERPLLEKMITGHYALQFWAMIFVGLVVPLLMLVTPLGPQHCRNRRRRHFRQRRHVAEALHHRRPHARVAFHARARRGHPDLRSNLGRMVHHRRRICRVSSPVHPVFQGLPDHFDLGSGSDQMAAIRRRICRSHGARSAVLV